MNNTDRRTFLKLIGSSSLAAAMPADLNRALAIPANNRHGSIRDVEHVVFLMQENRSFDHYFGTMRGVRGFADPHPVTLPSGKSVWHQPTAPASCCRSGRMSRPRSDVPARSAARLERHARRLERRPVRPVGAQQGRDDDDVPHQEGPAVPVRAGRRVHDLRQLPLLAARARPTRTATTCGPAGSATTAPPAVRSSPTPRLGYDWSTYPERLERAGISWKIYQDIGVGLDAAGLLGLDRRSVHRQLRRQLAALLPPVPERAAGQPAGRPGQDRHRTSTRSGPRPASGCWTTSATTSTSGRLPQVSWIVAPEAYTEHPNWEPDFGAWYVVAGHRHPRVEPGGVEQDGAVHHLRRGGRLLRPPGAADAAASTGRGPVDRADHQRDLPRRRRASRAGPYGLGMRVPMIVVSPWTQGRLGQLAAVRPHVADPLPRGALRRSPSRPGRRQHHAVAARGRRRPDERVRLQDAQHVASRSRCRAPTT